jgi:ParB family chromosome partitioning protein
MSKYPEIGGSYPLRKIALGSITDPTNRMRGHRVEKVAELVEPMREVGLINPITVKPFSDGGYLLLAGRHRLHAAKKLKWASIRCVVRDNLDRVCEQLVEIDENLMRREARPAAPSQGNLGKSLWGFGTR